MIPAKTIHDMARNSAPLGRIGDIANVIDRLKVPVFSPFLLKTQHSPTRLEYNVPKQARLT